MKCYQHHDLDAVGICMNCGKALCPECTNVFERVKIFCSEQCSDAASKFEKTIDTIQSKTLKQNKTTAYGIYFVGMVFVVYGLFNLFLNGAEFFTLAIFILIVGVSFLVWGVWYAKVGNENSA